MSTSFTHPARAAALRPSGARFSLTRLFALHRSRRALADLDGTRLDDIGISADRARAEAARPIWDVPQNWLR
jgi:uncharacterized protein YjiS (DUF1127 family)